jgi:hypothetical protein
MTATITITVNSKSEITKDDAWEAAFAIKNAIEGCTIPRDIKCFVGSQIYIDAEVDEPLVTKELENG